MAGRVQDKRIVVTGAGSGMGRSFALAREGATVGVLDLREEAARSVCDELSGEGSTAVPLTADVSRRDQVASAFDALVDEAGGLDVLFNKPMHLMDVTEDNWHSITDVNALGTLIGIQEGLAEHGITCNAFAPGVVDTPLWTQLDADLMTIGDSEKPGQATSDFASGTTSSAPPWTWPPRTRAT